ncbi:hypothetical protein EB061_11665, partial [bacterium]|nr:hypothetical protein [bacterium]
YSMLRTPLSTVLGLLVFFTIPLSAQAAVKEFKIGDDRFTVDVPKNWQTPLDFYGFPVTLIGPETPEGRRTVIGITPAGASDDEKVFDQGDKDLKAYIAGREAWLEQFDGKSISFDSYQKTRWEGIEEAHTLGYHYELPTGKFYERSLFVLCNGRRLYHVKTLVHSDHEKTDNRMVDDTLKTLKCVKTASAKTEKKK